MHVLPIVTEDLYVLPQMGINGKVVTHLFLIFAHTPLVLTITGLESRLAQSRPSAPSHTQWFFSRTVDIPN